MTVVRMKSETWSKTVNHRLERDGLLLHIGLQIEKKPDEQPRVVLKWSHESMHPPPWLFEMENVVMALGREAAWSVGIFLLGHTDVYMEFIRFRSTRKVPEGVTLFCSADATLNQLSPGDPPALICANVSGTVYTMRGDGEPVSVSEFDARVSHA